ncbi:MAG: Hsp33 family molecular chaperone HslO [Candidatus Cloacimonetes bacterium]|nr:Hsp33 family molecular chaperone HslO [Candidatus Cloacimonadota bacterium]
MKDRVIRGLSAGSFVRFFAVDVTETCKTAQKIHKLTPTASIVLGRLLAAGSIMAADLKSSQDILTLKINGDGPIGSVLVTARGNGAIKGYVQHPEVDLFNSQLGYHDIPAALGNGVLTIIKDMGLKEPYVGQVELRYGEIAQDLAYYYVQSEQIPTSVGLGVLLDGKGLVRRAGGFMVQLMPNTPPEVIDGIEANLHSFPNFTDMMDLGHEIETLIRDFILKSFSPRILDTKPLEYRCDCSRDKFLSGIKLLGKDELSQAIKDNETITVNCHFCNTSYHFEPKEIKKLIEELQ